jgi:hypothetical protein
MMRGGMDEEEEGEGKWKRRGGDDCQYLPQPTNTSEHLDSIIRPSKFILPLLPPSDTVA